MNINQRLHRLESQLTALKLGFFANDAELIISVVDQQGNGLYSELVTFTTPHGSTKKRIAP